MLFESWADLWHVGVAAALVYPALIVVLRASGKRTLGKMNAFDLVVTVAFGSTLATVLLSRGVTVAAGVVALVLLVSLQAIATWVSIHSARARDVLKSAPTLLFRDGEMLTEAMRSQRVTNGEVLQAIRSHGIGEPVGRGSGCSRTRRQLQRHPVVPGRRAHHPAPRRRLRRHVGVSARTGDPDGSRTYPLVSSWTT